MAKKIKEKWLKLYNPGTTTTSMEQITQFLWDYKLPRQNDILEIDGLGHFQVLNVRYHIEEAERELKVLFVEINAVKYG